MDDRVCALPCHRANPQPLQRRCMTRDGAAQSAQDDAQCWRCGDHGPAASGCACQQLRVRCGPLVTPLPPAAPRVSGNSCWAPLRLCCCALSLARLLAVLGCVVAQRLNSPPAAARLLPRSPTTRLQAPSQSGHAGAIEAANRPATARHALHGLVSCTYTARLSVSSSACPFRSSHSAAAASFSRHATHRQTGKSIAPAGQMARNASQSCCFVPKTSPYAL